MEAVLWSDYICPWCYLGQDRTALLESLGVRVTARPFELHPATPAGGIPLGRRYSRIATACEEVGLEFNAPPVLSNSHRALIAAEAVRRSAPERFDDVHRGFFRAYFVDGLDIGDPAVVAEVAGNVAADDAWLHASMEAALDAGTAGAPSWLIDGRLLIPGVQDRSYYERMVEKLTSSPPS
jgi:predicted DsbA family dithiol-disulfide isomerase